MRAIVIVGGLLAGCVSTPQYVTTYYRQATTQQEYQQDVYLCQRDAAPLRDVIRERGLINDCMKTKGYTARLERL